MLEELRSQGPVLVVDGGDLFWKSRVLSKARSAQQLEKARLQAAAYAASGIDVFVPGEGDYSLGGEVALGLIKTSGLPMLSAGLVCGEERWPGQQVFERGGVRLGIIGVSAEAPEGCVVADPVDSVSAAVLEQGPVDARLVVVHGTAEEVKRIGALESVDFVLDGHARKTWVDPRSIGGSGAYELGAGSRGKRLGVLSLQLEKEGAGWSPQGQQTGRHGFAHRVVDLDGSIGEHAETQKLVEEAKALIGAAVAPEQAVAPSAATGPFVGSSACLSCHPAQYAQWRTTPHATAMDTLRNVNRAADLDCFACHVTGSHHPLGPQHPAQVGVLEDVGCESCHGPGQAHVASPGASTIQRGAEPGTCRACHDGVKDGGRFDWETYLPKVMH